MKHTLFLLFAFVSTVVHAQQDYIDLVWSDEFEVDGAPDPANWGYDLGRGSNGWGNSEVQSYTNQNQNVRVEGGKLIIHALKEGGQWTSARIKSQGKRSFTYGRIVWRAKLPEGSGTWPALWMLGENFPTVGWPACGEIDVMEHVGKWPGQILSALHTPSSHGDTQNKGTAQNPTFSTEFHTYEVLWTPQRLTFYVDGVSHYTYSPAVKNSSTWPYNTPFFLIMNIAMGGVLGSDPQYESGGLRNGIDPALTQAKMEIDYVRVYQQFTELRLEGPAVVQKGQSGLSYKTNRLEGATYQWVVPDDAVIASGQGTSEIVIDWGQSEGPVKVIVTIGQDTYEKEMEVTHVVKPQGALFPLNSEDFSIEWANVDPVNEYHITEEAGQVRIDYKVTAPSSTVSVQGMFSRALDLSEHPVLQVRMRSHNQSKTLRVRMDLVDAEGRPTNKTPVFNLEPLIDDGVYFDYRFDVGEENKWQSQAGTVDASRINKINVYVDFGVFGSPGSDSLWIEDISVVSRDVPIPLSRPSHLSAKRSGDAWELVWRDHSGDEDRFTVYYGPSSEGPYHVLAETGANATSLLIPAHVDVLENYFKVTAGREDEESAFSNVLDMAGVVTSVSYGEVGNLSVFPNPTATGFVSIAHDLPAPVVIRILDIHGREKVVHDAATSPALLDLSTLAPGVYFISVERHPLRPRKLLIL